ncbi:MAG: hypothetical protein IJ410_03430 [Oscillospiraceae bacterium]|nr:hypothetical protein [Oscillospiraceae bacterium]
MREILFRAKRCYIKDEWKQGYLTRMWGTLHIVDENNENAAYAIVPETIGQYTGVEDKNGVGIYEGDILRREFADDQEEAGVDVCYAYVQYRNDEHGSGFFLVDAENGVADTLDLINCREFRVVGNIHDNPQLLEREAQL